MVIGPVAKERCQFRFKFINAVFRKLNGTLLECKTSLAFVLEPERLDKTLETQGDLTPNFPTFAKPIVLNLDFYMNADPGST